MVLERALQPVALVAERLELRLDRAGLQSLALVLVGLAPALRRPPAPG
jgi:hypothetical protein